MAAEDDAQDQGAELVRHGNLCLHEGARKVDSCKSGN